MREAVSTFLGWLLLPVFVGVVFVVIASLRASIFIPVIIYELLKNPTVGWESWIQLGLFNQLITISALFIFIGVVVQALIHLRKRK